jgi:L-threonylcarbamoyladenylate synthase
MRTMSAAPEFVDGREVNAPAGVARAVDCLRQGGCVGFPTESSYAIAIALDADRARSVVRELERAGWHSGASFHADREDAIRALPVVTFAARRLAKRYLPGPLVIVVHDAKTSLQVAVRVPGYGPTREVIRLAGRALVVHEPWPLDATPPPAELASDPRAVGSRFAGIVDLVLDGGPTRLFEPPAVVRADADDLAVVRPGILSVNDLMHIAQRRILFVCAGNTCRSPMAAALLVRALAQRLDIEPRAVASAGFVVSSAGAYAAPGMPASRGAKHAMTHYEIGLAAHRSTPVDLDLLAGQDRVFALTGSILEDLESAAVRGPRIEHIRRGEAVRDVRDPFGGDDAVYAACAAELADLVEPIADELIAEG